MASPTYRAVYKCRLCGKVYDAGKASFRMATKETALLLAGRNSCVNMTVMHACAADGIGVADFQGWAEEGGDADG